MSAETTRQLAQLVRDTEHELRTNPAYQPSFAGYAPAGVAAFIAAYAQRKEATDAGLNHRDNTNDEVSTAFEVLMEAEELVPPWRRMPGTGARP